MQHGIKIAPVPQPSHIHAQVCSVYAYKFMPSKKPQNFNSSLNIFGPHSLLRPFKAVVVKRAIWSFCPNYIQDKVVYVEAASYVPSETPL